MRIRFPATLAFSLWLLASAGAPLQAQIQEDSASDLTARVETAAEVLRQIQAVPEEQIPAELFHGGRGVAIFPKVIKVGLVVGGRFGQGVLSVRSEDGGWSSPVFMELAGMSFGFQIGASSTDVILVFKNRESVQRVLKGQVTLGAGASVAAGPVGRSAEAATDVQMEAEIYSYSRSRGVFAGIALEGATIDVDDAANDLFYGREGLRAQDILAGKTGPAPQTAQRLVETITSLTK